MDASVVGERYEGPCFFLSYFQCILGVLFEKLASLGSAVRMHSFAWRFVASLWFGLLQEMGLLVTMRNIIGFLTSTYRSRVRWGYIMCVYLLSNRVGLVHECSLTRE